MKDLLSLVMKEEHLPTVKQINTWSAKMIRDAEEWAAAEHFAASDNPVKRIPEPSFLRAYKRNYDLIQ